MEPLRGLKIASSARSNRSNRWDFLADRCGAENDEALRACGNTIICDQEMSCSYDCAHPSNFPDDFSTRTTFALSPLSSETGSHCHHSGLQHHRRHANKASEYGRNNEAASSLGRLPPERLRQQPKHPGGPSHRSLWGCSWPGCDKSYTRRDTLARHHANHKVGSHVCELCCQSGKLTAFKRKDHLNGHIRSCHKENTNSSGRSVENTTALSEWEPQNFAINEYEKEFRHYAAQTIALSKLGTPDFAEEKLWGVLESEKDSGQFASHTTALSELRPLNHEPHPSRNDWTPSDITEDKSDKGSLQATGDCADPRKQRQAMSDLVQILSRVLGDQWQETMGMLEDRVTSLSESKMQSLAKCMASVALIKTELPSPEHNESTHRGLQDLFS